jgi:Rha family phage regulatory protein
LNNKGYTLQIQPIVSIEKDKIVVTSNEVARVFGKEHKYVMRVIRELEIPNNIHEVYFTPMEIIDKNAIGGDINKSHYLITKDGFYLLAMGFTGKKAMEFKLAFIEAFNRMEQRLKGTDWSIERYKCVDVRKMETDVIKDFVQYATDQGSQSAKYYYKHITDATYSVLGLVRQKEPNFRNTLDLINLSQLQMAELVAARSLKRHMLLGEYYKDIFKLVKTDLEYFVSGILIDTRLELTHNATNN